MPHIAISAKISFFMLIPFPDKLKSREVHISYMKRLEEPYALDLPPLSPCSDDLCCSAFPSVSDFPEFEDTGPSLLFVVTCAYTLPEPQACPVKPLIKTETSKVFCAEKEAVDRKRKLERYRWKRERRRFTRKVAYECRKTVADRRLRVKGRFVTKQQELRLRTNTD